MHFQYCWRGYTLMHVNQKSACHWCIIPLLSSQDYGENIGYFLF